MNKKSSLNFKVIGFWFAMLAITALFIGLFINNLIQVRVFNNMDDIDRAGLLLVDDEIVKQEGTYYVYIYSEKSELNVVKKQELEPSVLNYFTYVALENAETPIYGYCVDEFGLGYKYGSVYKYLQTLHSDIKANNVPMLVKVKNGSISNVYYDMNKIQSELQSAMHTHDHDH